MVLGVFVHSFILKRVRDFAISGAHQPQITSSAPFNITVNTSASAPRPLYSRHTTHTKTISRDRGILDDFLIGFIPLSCH